MRVSRFSTIMSGRPYQLSARDLRIFNLLDPEYRYKYLPTNWLHALVGGEISVLRDRLSRLKENDLRYIELPTQQRTFNPLAKSLIWQRGTRGDKLLIEHGYITKPSARRGSSFWHEVTRCLIDASIELGAQDAFIPWRDLPVPDDVKQEPTRHKIHTSLGVIFPDGLPFLIRTDPKTSCCYFKEVDMSTEDHTIIETKLKRYAELFKDEGRLYRTKYKFPRARLLITTKTEERKDKLKSLTKKVLGATPHILFKAVPYLISQERTIPVTTDVYTTPWERVGYPDYYLGGNNVV